MQALLTSLKDPVWANVEHTLIDCVITTSQFGDEELPFTADPNDVEPHGRALFERIVAGEFGQIGEYVPPPEQQPGPTPSAGDIPVTEA
jgi:hypothetical protein